VKSARRPVTEPLLAVLTLVVMAMLIAVTYLGGGPGAILAVLPLALFVGFLLVGRFPGEDLLAELRGTRHDRTSPRAEPRPPLPRAIFAGVSLPLALLATVRSLRGPPRQGLPGLA
jgi:hypothetical protein